MSNARPLVCLRGSTSFQFSSCEIRTSSELEGLSVALICAPTNLAENSTCVFVTVHDRSAARTAFNIESLNSQMNAWYADLRNARRDRLPPHTV
jgi:hypothetical protein